MDDHPRLFVGRDLGDENDARLWHCQECGWSGPTSELSERKFGFDLPVCGGCRLFVVTILGPDDD